MTDNQSGPANLVADAQGPAELLDKRAAKILRGVQRLLRDHAFTSITEVPLANARRADVLAINGKGEIWIIEIKSSIADFRSDQKWPEYRAYCDRYFFAVAPEFPSVILPADAGLMLADSYGGEIMRTPQPHPLAAARRKSLILSCAMLSARRLHALIDPPEPSF